MIIKYDIRPDATVDEKLQSLMESIQLAFNNIDAGTLSGTVDGGRVKIIKVDGSNLIGTIDGRYLFVKNLDAEAITTGSIDAERMTAEVIEAINASIETIDAGRIDVDTIKAEYLDADYAAIDLANVNNAWIENGVIRNSAIGDAQIIGVSANKLTAGTIDASNITVTNLNADNITAGTLNGARIGEGSLGLNKLSDAVYTEDEVDGMLAVMQSEIDGAIETYTGTVVPTLNNEPASSWTTDDDKDKHVGDVYYVVNAGNEADGYCYRFTKSGSTYSWTLIKDNDVTAALQRLTEAEGNIEGLQTFESTTSTWITETNGEISSLQTRTSTVETSLGDKVSTSTFNTLSQTVAENTANITTLSDTVESKADGSTVETLSNTVNEVQQTASSNSSKISNLTTVLGTNADGTTATDDIVHRMSAAEQDLSGFKTTVSETYQTKSDMSNYSTTSQMESAIQQSASDITASVSETYQTKDAMSDYSTTTQMTAAINAKANEITTSVSSTYATKTEAEGYASDALDDAKEYTDSEVGTVSADLSSLTTRVSTAEQKITDSAIVSTVRSSTEYTTDLAGKASVTAIETLESEIDQQADRISMVVANEDASSSLQLTADAMSYIGGHVEIKDSAGTSTVISGGKIQANALTADEIDATDLHVAAANVDGTLEASQIKVSDIQIGAAQITSGTIATARIPNLSADKITSGDISADRMMVNSISAINDNTGTVKINADRLNITGTTVFSDGTSINGLPILDVEYGISNGYATFTAKVYQGGLDVTSNYSSSLFTWYRKTEDYSTYADGKIPLGAGYSKSVALSAMNYGGAIRCELWQKEEFNLIDNSGNYLVDSSGNYLVAAV